MVTFSSMGIHSFLVGLRALIFIPVSIFVLASTAILLAFLRGDQRYINGPLAKRWAAAVIWLAAAKVMVKGTENISSPEDSYPDGSDSDSSFIVIMNHQSNMDIPVLIHSMPLQLRFIGKIELKKIPVFGTALLRAGHFLIDRKDHDRAMAGIREAGQVLQHHGLSVVFAPEGTRSPDGQLLPFKKGAFVMAIETGIPLLPVTIDGTTRSLAKGSLWATEAEVTVTIHEPVPTADLTYEDRNELIEKVRGIMEKTLLSGGGRRQEGEVT
jgi:1-acyl-sn-glycerol-3-phosphate acyltransferase